HARLAYEARIFRELPMLTLGARSSLSLVAVTDGELTLWGWLAWVGPHVGARLPIAIVPGSTLSVGVGPALARSGFRIDENLERDFWAFAYFGFAQATFTLSGALRLALDASLEHVLPAPKDQSFFNRQLGSTTLLGLALGVALDF